MVVLLLIVSGEKFNDMYLKKNNQKHTIMIKKTLRKILEKKGYSVQKKEYLEMLQKNHLNELQTVRKNLLNEIESVYKCLFMDNVVPAKEDRWMFLNQLIGTSLGEAMYILQSLHKGLQYRGDICEFGVAQGATSLLLASEILQTQKHLWLFDSFEGLPRPTEKDKLIDDIFNLGSMEAYKGTMSCPEDMVKKKLTQIDIPLERIHICKGWINETIKSKNVPSEVCFAYVDFDFYEPIKDALNYLDEVIVLGGEIIVDDYKWFSEGAQIAVDEFINEKKNRYKLSLPIEAAGKFAILSRVNL